MSDNIFDGIYTNEGSGHGPTVNIPALDARISDLEAELAKGFPGTLWIANALAELKAARADWSQDELGDWVYQAKDPIVYPDVQFSPEEVLDVEGWQTLVPRNYGKLPYWGQHIPSIDAGLVVSVARDNGCYVIKNLQDTADEWINNADEVAKANNTTARLIRVAGYALSGRKYMVPTGEFRVAPAFATGNNPGFTDMVIEPEGAPYNDEEVRVFRQMFRAYAFGGGNLAGARWVDHNLELYPALVDSTQRVRLGAPGRYNVTTIGNNPQWIVPSMMAKFNTSLFKKDAWHGALSRCHEVDNGQRKPMPGYSAPTVFESGASKDRPKFK